MNIHLTDSHRMTDSIDFLTSALTAVEPRIFETKYAEIIFPKLVPLDNMGVTAADNTYMYRSYDAATMAKFITADSTDLPKVATSYKTHTVKISYAGVSFSYTRDELRQASQLGIRLLEDKYTAAVRGTLELQQKVVLFGDTDRGMYGLFNHPNVTLTTTNTDWTTASAIDINQDITKLLSTVISTSKLREIPTTILLPAKRFDRLVSTPFTLSNYAVGSLLNYILQSNVSSAYLMGQSINIIPVQQLNGAGLGGVDRAVAYIYDPTRVFMKQPLPFIALAPQLRDLDYHIPCECKFTGTEFRYPLSAAYLDFPEAL